MRLVTFVFLICVIVGIARGEGFGKPYDRAGFYSTVRADGVEDGTVSNNFAPISPHIVEGIEANSTYLKSSALIRIRMTSGNYYMCTATIIRRQYLLCAAHCFTGEGGQTLDLSGTVAYLQSRYAISSAAGQPRQIAKVFVHEKYSFSGIQYDISVVKLKEAIPKSMFAHVHIGDPPRPGTKVVAAGYGRLNPSTSSSYLMQGRFTYSSPSSCSLLLSPNFRGAFPKYVVCCLNDESVSSTCQGDSGGGVFYTHKDGKLVHFGITSFGTGAACALKGQGSFFTKSVTYRKAIHTIVKKGGHKNFKVYN